MFFEGLFGGVRDHGNRQRGARVRAHRVDVVERMIRSGLAEDIWIVDDFKNGPSVKGEKNIKDGPVSKADKEKADEVFNRILKELGLEEEKK